MVTINCQYLPLPQLSMVSPLLHGYLVEGWLGFQGYRISLDSPSLHEHQCQLQVLDSRPSLLGVVLFEDIYELLPTHQLLLFLNYWSCHYRTISIGYATITTGYYQRLCHHCLLCYYQLPLLPLVMATLVIYSNICYSRPLVMPKKKHYSNICYSPTFVTPNHYRNMSYSQPLVMLL